MELTHLNARGEARMVDIGEKEITKRAAQAQALVRMRPETLCAIQQNALKKGDVLAAARIAGIMAAKRTPELIPLCHAIPLEEVTLSFAPLEPDRLEIRAEARATFRTGVEMEALTAASVAALTVYDMCKAIDKGMVIESVCLLYKAGGRSGTYRRETP